MIGKRKKWAMSQNLFPFVISKEYPTEKSREYIRLKQRYHYYPKYSFN